MNAPTRVTFKEFPDVEFPAELRALGLHDESWHNDVAPRATYELKGDRELCVWVYEDDASEREMGNAEKYSVVIYSHDHSEELATIGEGDDLRNIVAMCQAVIFADNLEDADFRLLCMNALMEEYATDAQVAALNGVYEYASHVLNRKEWRTLETYLLKAADYEGVRATLILMSTKGTAGVTL